MSKFIDQNEQVKIESIDDDWLQVKLEHQTYVLSYDAAIDMACMLAAVTSQMDERKNTQPQSAFLN
ncbi:MAG: hypothetical protein K2P92_03610 [Bdellovibrionaceae bacterium]|nr:hypothetical protein [Pseudobdellovibrionaceae bacterium]